MKDIRILSLNTLQQRYSISCKLFALPVFLWLCAVLIYVPLGFVLPKTGAVLCFIIGVVVPAIIAGWYLKNEISRMRCCKALFEKGFSVCRLKVCKKEIWRDNDNADCCRLIMSDPDDETGEQAKFSEDVSRKMFNKVAVGSVFYAVFLKKEDQLGTRYISDGIYWGGEYVLAEELETLLVPYETVAAANQKYADVCFGRQSVSNKI